MGGVPTAEKASAFGEPWRRFRAGIASLRILLGQVAAFADSVDHEAVQSVERVIESVLPSFKELDQALTEAKEAGRSIAPDDLPDPLKEKLEADAKVLASNPEGFRRLVTAVRDFAFVPPRQGPLIRQAGLILLVSVIETLIADLLHAYYDQHPESLGSSERTMTLAELKAVGSIEEAERHIIAKEIDAVLRESFDRQVQHFGRLLKQNLSERLLSLPRLVEIDQRRNLYVHASGVVNREYLNRVASELVKEYGAESGQLLVLTDSYLDLAVSTVEVFGQQLLQLAWRKWDSGNTAIADTILVTTTYEALGKSRLDQVEELARFGLEQAKLPDESKRMLLLNRAIAHRDGNRQDAALALIESMDWSASALHFKIAVAVIRADRGAIENLLPKAIASGDINLQSVREWPLFLQLRSEEWFVSLCEANGLRVAESIAVEPSDRVR